MEALCTTRDEFIEDKCIWIVELKDGTKVFQDDGRDGAHPPSAWRRLGRHVTEHPDNPIAKMWLRFGTHVVALPEGQSLYFYSCGLIQPLAPNANGLDFHIVGWPSASVVQCGDKQGRLMRVWYKSPELVITKTDFKDTEHYTAEQVIRGTGENAE